MKILKVVLLVVGIGLIIIGLYTMFIPKDVLDIGILKVTTTDGITNQTLGMIGLGVFALIAGAYLKNRR